MTAKTELFLYRLCWLAEKPLVPTFRNIDRSFEGWAYDNGLLSQISRLETEGLLESQEDPNSGRKLHRLTEAGTLIAMSGCDPEAAWGRPWDQKWRLFLFDIPEVEGSKRRKLTRALRSAKCGCLQGSVWITPLSEPKLEQLIKEDDTDCARLLLLMADSKGRAVDQRMVTSSWDFKKIDEAYNDLSLTLDQFQSTGAKMDRRRFEEWTRKEKEAWDAVKKIDPFLPSELQPRNYQGQKVWRRRLDILERAASCRAKFESAERE
ncbi:MAG: hypothetical protein AAF236_08625 [Verrucomicrobiota bacterium]